jgi:hypothetical protein
MGWGNSNTKIPIQRTKMSANRNGLIATWYGERGYDNKLQHTIKTVLG